MKKIVTILSLFISVVLLSAVCVSARTPNSTINFNNLTEINDFASAVSSSKDVFDAYHEKNDDKVLHGICFHYVECQKIYEKITKVPFVACINDNSKDLVATFNYEYNLWRICYEVDGVKYWYEYDFDIEQEPKVEETKYNYEIDGHSVYLKEYESSKGRYLGAILINGVNMNITVISDDVSKVNFDHFDFVDLSSYLDSEVKEADTEQASEYLEDSKKYDVFLVTLSIVVCIFLIVVLIILCVKLMKRKQTDVNSES